MTRKPVQTRHLCAMATDILTNDPTIDDAEWRERIKCRLALQRFTYPPPHQISDAMAASERVWEKAHGPRPLPLPPVFRSVLEAATAPATPLTKPEAHRLTVAMLRILQLQSHNATSRDFWQKYLDHSPPQNSTAAQVSAFHSWHETDTDRDQLRAAEERWGEEERIEWYRARLLRRT